jgi:uncharacterized protein (DUF2236 family)
MGRHDVGGSHRDGGYFPPGSMLRFVQEHRVVGQTYGQRALVLGATSPVPYVGTSSSTLAKERPFTRLSATANAFETIFFGSTDEADKLLGAVHTMHTQVRGVLDEDAGLHRAGTPYDAFDPELMLWTMAVLADSSRHCFETLVRPMSAAEREELWQDWITFGVLFGMPREVAPPSSEAFDAWMGEHLSGPRFHVTDEARVVGRAIVRAMPVPARLRAGVRVTSFVVVGLLPERVREAFGLDWGPVRAQAHRALAATLRGSRHVIPESVRLGGNRRLFDIVTRSESQILAAGGATMELPHR